ncbi:hypothetical protein GM609_00290 [Bombella sp. ESL0387]|nr:hypothetical protein [Bombella sp. ESL0387]
MGLAIYPSSKGMERGLLGAGVRGHCIPAMLAGSTGVVGRGPVGPLVALEGPAVLVDMDETLAGFRLWGAVLSRSMFRGMPVGLCRETGRESRTS